MFYKFTAWCKKTGNFSESFNEPEKKEREKKRPPSCFINAVFRCREPLKAKTFWFLTKINRKLSKIVWHIPAKVTHFWDTILPEIPFRVRKVLTFSNFRNSWGIWAETAKKWRGEKTRCDSMAPGPVFTGTGAPATAAGCTHLHFQHRWGEEGRGRLPTATGKGGDLQVRTTCVTSEKHQAGWRQAETREWTEGEEDRQKVGPVVSKWSDRGRRSRAERWTEMDGGRATPV